MLRPASALIRHGFLPGSGRRERFLTVVHGHVSGVLKGCSAASRLVLGVAERPIVEEIARRNYWGGVVGAGRCPVSAIRCWSGCRGVVATVLVVTDNM